MPRANGCWAWMAAAPSKPCSFPSPAAARFVCLRRSAADWCSFCSTGTQGFESQSFPRRKSSGRFCRGEEHLGNVPHYQRKLTNVVMMGMGEPLLNFDNVVRAMSVMRDDLGFGLANKRVTLSTAGLVPMIDKLGETSDVSLPFRCTRRTMDAHRTGAAQ